VRHTSNFFSSVAVACKVILLTLLLAPDQKLQAQDEELMIREMETGSRLMAEGKFQEADRRFRFVLDNSRILPADIAFYFGANSYYLERYKQSINWLNKYIELKGTSGQFFEKCTELLQLAEEKYREMSMTITKSAEPVERDTLRTRNSEDRVFALVDCGDTKVVCPVCNGRGVIIKTSVFGERSYKTCPYGDEHGLLTCEEYNLLLQGKLEPRR
jgi:tetratricopeptide (TPR) repeat protein